MENYIEQALRTEPDSEQYQAIIQRASDINTIRLLHALIGMTTELGEMLDNLKKHIFYGKELDLINLGEEIADSDWYRSIAIDFLAKKFDLDVNSLDCKIKENNINKLKARYPNKFSKDSALNRDLDKERKILEDI